MEEFETRDLHFAAYVKTFGAEFIAYRDKAFRFRSDKTAAQWRIEHANGCCRRVDLELIELRKFLRG